MKFFRDITTDNTGTDFDIISLLGIVAFVFFLGFTTYTVIQNKTFDPITYCAGAAGLLVGISGGYRMKAGKAE